MVPPHQIPSAERFRKYSAAALLFSALLPALWAQTQPSTKPLSKDDVVQLLKGNVPVKRVETLARQRGIDFPITPATESELRQAGANESLLGVLEELAPSPPASVPASPYAGKLVSGINPIFTSDASFAIPGTSPIGTGLMETAKENVNKAVGWLNPLIHDARGSWAELLSWQPRNPDNGVIGVHFSVGPAPPTPTAAPQLVMSKSQTSLSMGIPAEHYQDPGAIFADVLELFIWNLPPQMSHSAHDKLVQQVRKTAAEFSYPGDPLPPEVLARFGVRTSSQAKSLDADTPDSHTNAAIYDGDIQGRVIGSTVKCFNFLFNKGVPYLTKLQNTAVQKTKESFQAGDAQVATEWQNVATTLGDDVHTINSLLESLPAQLKVDFYYRAAEQTTAHGKPGRPTKIPESEPGVRITIALPRDVYTPAAVKDALIQELSSQARGIQIGRAVNDFFLLFAEDPANQGDFYAVTMQQLHPQPDEALGTLSKLWPVAAR
jgi:hypothetical protein